MTIWIGITDNAWFDFLSAMKPDEVNFWHPNGPCSFRVLQPGEIFFFKLKSPRRKIAGWARFVTHFNMPLSLAWRTFESKNGARDFRSFSEMILRHGSDKHPERWIGCTTLNNPVFLDEDEWFDPPSNWPITGIQQGRRYNSDDPMAASLVEAALLSESAVALEAREISDDDARYGSAYLTRARLGQGAFKTLVLQAYNSHCGAACLVLPQGWTGADVEVRDLAGRIVRKVHAEADGGLAEFSCEGLPTGTYLLAVTSGEETTGLRMTVIR